MRRSRRHINGLAALGFLATSASAALACSEHDPVCLCGQTNPPADSNAFSIIPPTTRGGGLGSLANTTLVHVFNFEFSAASSGPPVDPTINVGDTIHWLWDASFHNVTSVAGSAESFHSNTLNAGATFDH